MTYKIEITADTVAELTGRILAMAAQFQPTGTTSAKIDPVMPEVKQAAVGEPAVVADELSPPSSDDPVSSTAPTAASLSDAPVIDYKADVVPRVMAVVQTKGREVMEDILSQYGVSRAPEVPQELLGEFIVALDEVLTR